MGRYHWGGYNPSDWIDWNSWPRGQFGRFFGAGEVRLAILSLLSEGPKNGYELMKELRTRSGGSYRMSAGTVYPALQQLEDEGLIVPDPKEGKKLFRITELGLKELEREKDTVDEIWRRTSERSDWAQWMGPGAALFAGPLGALIKTTFQAMKSARGNPEVTGKIGDILDRARRDIEDICG
jgi:DNA-binding PadR family transcriptional regulator